MNWPLDHPAVMGGYLMAIGLLFFGVAGFYVRRGICSGSWPCVSAVVTATKPIKDSDDEWSVKITYSYIVDDRTLERTEEMTSNWPTLEFANATEANYRPGSEIPVWYNPNKPSVSVIKTGVTFNSWLWLAIGLACIVGGASMLVAALS